MRITVTNHLPISNLSSNINQKVPSWKQFIIVDVNMLHKSDLHIYFSFHVTATVAAIIII